MVNTLKSRLKHIAPSWLHNAYRRMTIFRIRRGNSELSTKEVFTRIYREKKWSVSSHSDFQSGSGSSDTIATAYSNFVNEFITKKSIKSLVDLGCGDFNVGKRLQHEGITYIGVDIVDDLIEYNNKQYGNSETLFLCRDITRDNLPPADLCLIRQVFQHLSNQQILSALPKLQQYKYILISEHYPADNDKIIPNVDKPHGEDTRVYDNSGVYLDKPPFNLKNVQIVFEIDAPPIVALGEKIRTVLLENSGIPTASQTQPVSSSK